MRPIKGTCFSEDLDSCTLAMARLQVVICKAVFLIVFWFAAADARRKEACNVTVFATTEAKECPTLNATHLNCTVNLADFPAGAKNCDLVRVYFTSGTHLLTEDLDFTKSVKSLELSGDPKGRSSFVQCCNESGIRFGESKSSSVLFLT